MTAQQIGARVQNGKTTLLQNRPCVSSRINSPWFSFGLAFAMSMLGSHKPQKQATVTRKTKSQSLSLSQSNREKILNPGIYFFACDCFRGDGVLEYVNRVFQRGGFCNLAWGQRGLESGFWEGLGRGWGRVGEGLGKSWGGEGFAFYTSKTLCDKYH